VLVNQSSIRKVPPAPSVISALYARYLKERDKREISWKQFLKETGYTNKAHDLPGMDDNRQESMDEVSGTKPKLIEIPHQPISGQLNVKVLLVDFDDRPGNLPKEHYENMLFTRGSHLTGSLYHFYKEVSLGNVEITGTVDGWLRLPKPYSYYTNNESGTGKSYPKNAQGMARDAVKAALAKGIKFPNDLDKLRQKNITALFIIHAGTGAERLQDPLQKKEIWSHKWTIPDPVKVSTAGEPELHATIYLTVPYDCDLGVCAHELGHLAFQWQDFYDPNYNEDGSEWDGNGNWDLMAGGSYNGGGLTPAHPAGLHKNQHNWVETLVVDASSEPQKLTLKPFTSTEATIAIIRSENLKNNQYLLLENRQRVGFDSKLPSGGLLIWRVDESNEMEAPDAPGMYLIQADGKHNLEFPSDGNVGDAGDPFPGSSNRTTLLEKDTRFPKNDGGAKKSGIELTDIRVDAITKVVTLSVSLKE
jgi:immune inhibitor A